MRLEHFREPEIEHLDGAVRPHLDVGRFQIAVDDAAIVRRLQGRGYLAGDAQRLVNWQRSPGDPIGEGGSFDELEHQRADPFRFLQPVDRPNLRMVQRGQHARFELEAREAVGVGQEGVREDLDRDIAAEFRVARAVHLAHSAGAEKREKFVRTKLSIDERPMKRHAGPHILRPPPR
jgi:hypothetical protein